MAPLERKQHWELVTSFVFGVTFLATMLVIAIMIPAPTDQQMLIFRIVTSIAVAGIGAVVPGFIVMSIPPYVRAGGSLALFVMVYMVNPPAFAAKDYTPFSDAIRRAEAAVASQNHTAAITFFEKAKQAKPDSWLPYNGLGRAYYATARYKLALKNLKRAFMLQGETDGALAYAVSVAQDALGEHQEALKTLEIAEALQQDSPLKNDIVYDKGLMNLIIWLRHGAPADSRYFHNATICFNNFLSQDGSPSHWAYYNLACLEAERARDVSLTDAAKNELEATAVNHLQRAVEELKAYNSIKAPMQRKLMKDLLLEQSPSRRQAGTPVICSALVAEWKETRGPIADLLALIE